MASRAESTLFGKTSIKFHAHAQQSPGQANFPKPITFIRENGRNIYTTQGSVNRLRTHNKQAFLCKQLHHSTSYTHVLSLTSKQININGNKQLYTIQTGLAIANRVYTFESTPQLASNQ